MSRARDRDYGKPVSVLLRPWDEISSYHLVPLMKYHNRYVHITIIGSEKNHNREPTSTIIGSKPHGRQHARAMSNANACPHPSPAITVPPRRNWTKCSALRARSCGEFVLNSTAPPVRLFSPMEQRAKLLGRYTFGVRMCIDLHGSQIRIRMCSRRTSGSVCRRAWEAPSPT